MIKKYLKNFIIGGLLLSLLVITPSQAANGTYDFQGQSGLDSAAGSAGYETGSNSTPVETIISQVLYAVLGLVGIVFFGYLIYGAYTWMTSRGNDEKIQEATNTLVNAIIGLIITLGAYVLTNYLIQFFWPLLK